MNDDEDRPKVRFPIRAQLAGRPRLPRRPPPPPPPTDFSLEISRAGRNLQLKSTSIECESLRLLREAEVLFFLSSFLRAIISHL